MSLGSWARRFQVPRALRARGWAWSIPGGAGACRVLSVGLFAALAAYAYRGWFSRYTADDYCMGRRGADRAAYRRPGAVVRGQWSGRVTYYFILGVVDISS